MGKAVFCKCKNTYKIDCDCTKYPDYWKQGIGSLETEEPLPETP